MLKEIIKIANELDSRGLVGEADALDMILTKSASNLSGGDVKSVLKGVEDAVSSSPDEAAKSIFARELKRKAKALAKKMNRYGGVVVGSILDFSNHSSWESWASSQPDRIGIAAAQKKFLQEALLRGSDRIVNSGILGLAFAIPALAAWNFSSIGKPYTKLKKLHWFTNRKNRRLGRSLRPLAITDFDTKDVNLIRQVNGVPENVEISRLTGTPGPLMGYLLEFISTGGINALTDAKAEGLIDDDVWALVRDAGLRGRRAMFSAPKIMNEIKSVTREFWPDTPPDIT